MEPKKTYLYEYIVCLKLFAIGIFSLDNREPVPEKNRIIIHIMTWIIVESAYIAGCFDAANFSDMLMTFATACSVMLSIVKYIAFSTNRVKLQNILKLIEIDGIEYCKTDEFVLKAVKESRRNFFIYLSITSLCPIAMWISASFATSEHAEVYEVKMWEPIHVSLPYDVVVFERYGIFTITTIFVSFYHGYSQAFLDCFIATLFIHVGRQFEAVAYTFANLDLTDSVALSDKNFNNAVEYHKAVLRCAEDLQDMFTFCFLGQIIESSLPLCLCLYLIVQNMNNNEGTVADILTYMSLLQYFIYQLYLMTRSADVCSNRRANYTNVPLNTLKVAATLSDILGVAPGPVDVEIRILLISSMKDAIDFTKTYRDHTYDIFFLTACVLQAVSVSDGVYNNNWHLTSPSMKRQMTVVMQRAQRPLKFTACGIFPISILMFIQIMRSAYAAFTLLTNVD